MMASRGESEEADEAMITNSTLTKIARKMTRQIRSRPFLVDFMMSSAAAPAPALDRRRENNRISPRRIRMRFGRASTLGYLSNKNFVGELQRAIDLLPSTVQSEC